MCEDFQRDKQDGCTGGGGRRNETKDEGWGGKLKKKHGN